jgi:ATP-binding cassette, subfamily C, bacterial exporter for protease/lipase
VVHALPEGINSRIGEDGAKLSGGQRQRLGLARALYGAPRLLVLDEPNANLDEAGDKNLIELLASLKQQGLTIIVITHRTNLLAVVDKLLVLRDGATAAFGPRDEVMQAMRQAAAKQAAVAGKGTPAGSRPAPGADARPGAAPGQTGVSA